MNQASPRPEQVIRHYLETHEGPVESHILHLKQTFEFDDLSPENLRRAAEALREVEVRVEPPLEEVAADGRLTLSIAGDGPRRTERKRIGQALLRRVSAKDGPARRRQAQEQRAEQAAALAAARTALAEILPAGETGARLERALDVLEEGAGSSQETLAAIDHLLAELGAEAGRRLDEAGRRLGEAGEALTSTAAARDEVAAGLAELEEDLAQLAERDESVRGEVTRGADRRSRLLLEWEEELVAARDALERVLSPSEDREGVESGLAELTAATQQLSQAREAGLSEVARWEKELEQFPSRVAEARAAVEHAISDQSVHDQLEARVAALREAETAQEETRRHVEQARSSLEAGLEAAQAGFESALQGLGEALAGEGEGEGKEELLERFNALGDVQRQALQAAGDELSSWTALPGDGRTAAELKAGLADLRNRLSPDGENDAAGQATLEAALEANRAALDTLRPIAELQPIRERATAEFTERLAEAEHLAAEASAKLEQAEREAGVRLAGFESEREAREADLERAHGEAREATAELEAVRAQAEEARGELDAATAQLEQARADAAAVEAHLDEAEAAAEGRAGELSRRLHEVEASVREREEELERVRSEAAAHQDALRGEAEAARVEAEAARVEAEAARAEAEAARAEAREATAELEAVRAQAEEARGELDAVRAGLEQGRAEAAAVGARLDEAEVAAEEPVGENQSAFERRLAELNDEVAAARSTAEALRTRAEEAERHVDELKEELSSTRREADDRLSERDAELDEARYMASTSEADTQLQLLQAEEKLAASEAEIEKVLAGEKEAREQVTKLSKELEEAREKLGRRRLERRQAREDHLVEAIESVRRALTDEIDGPSPPRPLE